MREVLSGSGRLCADFLSWASFMFGKLESTQKVLIWFWSYSYTFTNGGIKDIFIYGPSKQKEK